MSQSRSVRWMELRLTSGGSVRAGGDWLLHGGQSMLPALQPGDRLRVLPTADPPPSAGEIVVVRRGPVLVAHRLVAVKGALAFTRGDANYTRDPPIAASALVGRIVEVERHGRRIPPAPAPGLLARMIRWLRALR